MTIQNVTLLIKTMLTAFFAWLSVKLGVLLPIMGILGFAMMMDFVTAWIAAIATDEKLQSEKCRKGIARKIGYICGVLVGTIADTVIVTLSTELAIGVDIPPCFGITVAIWLILNELISIIENLDRAGVKLPGFLKRLIKSMQKTVDQKGDAAAPPEGE